MPLLSSPRRILVTGGTGFIGSALCQRLVGEGHEVTVLTRRPDKARLPARVVVVKRLNDIANGAEPFDVLINLAGEPLAGGRWTQRRKRIIRQSRIEFTQALFDYFQRSGKAPGILLNASAIGYYGPHRDEVLDEWGRGVPSFSHQLCQDWENTADAFTDLGTRVCKIRIGVVIGPDGGALKKMVLPFKLGLGGPIGDGRQWFSWIHRDDLIRLFAHCIEHQTLQGVINGTAPEPVRNGEFAEALSKAVSRRSRFTAPAWLMLLVYGEMAEELLLSGQRVIPLVALESGFEYRYPSLEPALEAALHPASGEENTGTTDGHG